MYTYDLIIKTDDNNNKNNHDNDANGNHVAASNVATQFQITMLLQQSGEAEIFRHCRDSK